MASTESLSGVKTGSAKGGTAAVKRRDTNSVAYVEILDVDRALATLGGEWRNLECDTDAATVFQGVAWAGVVQSWLSGTVSGQPEHDHQVVITRDRTGRLTGIWPIQVEYILRMPFAVALGEPFTQYSDILVASGADRAIVVDAMLVSVHALGRFSGVLMRKVRDDAICVEHVARIGRELNVAAAPAVDLRPFHGFDAYHQSVKAKTRKNLRNARNRLERSGERLTHIVHIELDAIAEVARRAYHLRSVWLEQEGHSSRAFLDEGFEPFIDALCHADRSADGMRLLAFELRLGDEMLSLQWGFVDSGRYYAFMAVRNPAFDAQSPGRLHLEYVIRSCSELGIEVVDFLAPDVSYKRTWATETVSARDYGIGFTMAGQIVLSGVLGAPRRFARRVFDALPHGLRHFAIRLLSRKSD